MKNKILLKIKRFLKTDKTTISELHIENNFICYTLEPFDSELTYKNSKTEIIEVKRNIEKSGRKMAIVSGLYQIQFKISPTFSNKKIYASGDFTTLKYLFNSDKGLYLPYIINPSHNNTLFHIGNFAKDTFGCVLPGLSFGKNCVNNSKDALFLLLKGLDYIFGAGIKCECLIESGVIENE